jgi:hypothetical protein
VRCYLTRLYSPDSKLAEAMVDMADEEIMGCIKVNAKSCMTEAIYGLTAGALSCLLLCCGMTGCAGGGSYVPPPPPPPAPDFTITASPSSVNVAQGGTSAPVIVSISGTNGFTGVVSVAISGLPGGASASPSSALSISANSSQQFTVTTAAGAPTGSSALIMSGTSGSISHMATTTLTTNFAIPSAWTPTGVDYGTKKQCIRTVSPTLANFYFDDIDCPGSSYPTSVYWTTAVETETLTGLCVGAVDQSLPINTAGSPVTETWTGSSSAGYSVELKTDYSNIANPCAPHTYTWVPLMDNWVGGGPLPAPNHLVTEFNATFNRTLPAGSGATRAFAGVVAQWDIAGANNVPVLATFEVEVNFYTDQPAWGVQSGQPPDVIAFRTNTSSTPPFYYVDLDGSKLFAPISAQISNETLITVNWAAVLQHVVDEGLLPPPINGWSNSNAVTTATDASTEVGNFISGIGGPMADLVVSNYQEGSF